MKAIQINLPDKLYNELRLTAIHRSGASGTLDIEGLIVKLISQYYEGLKND